MEEIVLGLARTVVEGTVTKVKSAIEEEDGLKLTVLRDLHFITGEFEMMQAFLNVASGERIKNDVVRTWVRQVRNLAYDVEDCTEYVIHLDKKTKQWWRLLLPSCVPAAALPMKEAVAEINQLKARVDDVSQRNMRYNLISNSAPPSAQHQQQQPPAATGMTAFDMLVEAKDTARKQRGLSDLTELVAMKGVDLEVISVWGTGGDLGTTSIVRKVYDDPAIGQIFTCRAWVKAMHPFNPHEFIRSLVAQFYANSLQEQHGEILGAHVLDKMKEVASTEDNLIKDFKHQVTEQAYLVVLEDLSTMIEWDAIRMYLPDMKRGSRILVSTQKFEIANLCTGQPCRVSELKQFSVDHSICVFFKEGTQCDGENGIASFNHENADIEMSGNLVGRLEEEEKLCQRAYRLARNDKFGVISVWGIPGVGKSTFVRNTYRRLMQGVLEFKRFSWVNVFHPFNLREFSRSLLSGLYKRPSPETGNSEIRSNYGESSEFYPVKENAGFGILGTEDPIKECYTLLHEHNCLIVINGLQSTEEWDIIDTVLIAGQFKGIIIVITTEPSVATHCSGSDDKVVNVKVLEADAANDLFNKKVFQNARHAFDADVNEQAKLILHKCGGIPKVIVAIGGFLATRNKTKSELMKLNKNFMHKLEIDEGRHTLGDLFAWMHSYFRSYPDSLKPCLYLSIFPGEKSIRRRRLVRRWIAEGYCGDTGSNTAEDIGEMFFSKLVELSMIQQSLTRTVLCQVNGFFREYISSRSMEDNDAFTLDSCSSQNSRCTARHLTLGSSWVRDKIVFENIDFSRLRSLTVFGQWEEYFISDKMRLLRVLDLEDTKGLTDDDVKKITLLLPRLKFLSLRGCSDIYRLPSSLGDLKQLQTLDVRYTSVAWLPGTIIKLHKLQYIRAGAPAGSASKAKIASLETAQDTAAPSNGRQRTTASWFPDLRRHRVLAGDQVGVEVSSDVGDLTNLHTLGIIRIDAEAKDIVKELKKLTQLHKLGVSGVNRKNSKEFFSAISGHRHLRSLSVRLINDKKGSCVSLDSISPPPDILQSLKIYGHMDKLPVWIKQLSNLKKLEFETGIIAGEDIEILADLELVILRLWINSKGEELHFESIFNSLKVLEIACNPTLHVIFGKWAMENLEVLKVHCSSGRSLQISGLEHLCSIKEISF